MTTKERFEEIEGKAGKTVVGVNKAVERLQGITRHLIEICKLQQEKINALEQIHVRELSAYNGMINSMDND